jgi:hypothetical protein
MRTIKLLTTTQKIIYEGTHPTLKSAIETAVAMNISLDEIDLSYANIDHINLDGVTIHNANFKEANLYGANMSEARFTSCNFSGALLYEVCLCYTDLKDCNFKYTNFLSTDISMATLISCAFEGWDAFRLDFKAAYKLQDNHYTHHGKICKMDTPPSLVITPKLHMAILDEELINKEIPNTFGHNAPVETLTPLLCRAAQSLIEVKTKPSKN